MTRRTLCIAAKEFPWSFPFGPAQKKLPHFRGSFLCLYHFADGDHTGGNDRAVFTGGGDHTVAAVVRRDNTIGADRGDLGIVAGPHHSGIGGVFGRNRCGQ